MLAETLSKTTISSQWWVCGNMSTGTALTGMKGNPLSLFDLGRHKLWITVY